MFKKHIKADYYGNPTRNEWLAIRKRYTGIDTKDHFAVGGSEIATIMDLNKYESSLEFYQRAIGELPPKRVHNLQVLRGTKFEYTIYQEFFRYFNPDEWNVWNDEEHRDRFIENAMYEGKVFRTAQRCNAVVSNPKYPHLFINYDFILHKSKWNDRGPLEIKSQMGAAMDHWEDGINPAYMIQTLGQMLVGEFKYGELFVLRNNELPVSFPQEPNKVLMDQIVAKSEEWANRVCSVKALKHAGAPRDEVDMAIMEYEPDIVENEAWLQFLKDQHKPENQNQVQGEEEFLQDVITFLKAKKSLKDEEEKVIGPEVRIRKFLKDSGATKVILPNGLGHVSNVKKLSISPSILKKYQEQNQESLEV